MKIGNHCQPGFFDNHYFCKYFQIKFFFWERCGKYSKEQMSRQQEYFLFSVNKIQSQHISIGDHSHHGAFQGQ